MKIIDTSCLICFFSEITAPEILFKWIERGHKLFIPHEVYSELASNYNTKEKVYKEIKSKKIKIMNPLNAKELSNFKKRHPTLGKGELATILQTIKTSKTMTKCYAILDDKKARTVANKYGIKFTGSYGLIIIMKKKSLISAQKCQNFIEKIKNSKFRLKSDI